MKKSVGCFTEEKLRALAQEPNVTVYQPTHDIVYTPWSADRVMKCVDSVAQMTRDGKSVDEVRATDELREFSEKYTVFFQKLTDRKFVDDPRHVETVKKIVSMKDKVDRGLMDENTAKAESADIALQSLVSRVPK